MELAKELGKKGSAEKYAAFLDFVPAMIAREARQLDGGKRERALDAYAKARELAATKAVVAMLKQADRGQIAIIMPGAAVASGRWGLRVPVSVSARVDHPEKSVYAKALSWLFAGPQDVVLYAQR